MASGGPDYGKTCVVWSSSQSFISLCQFYEMAIMSTVQRVDLSQTINGTNPAK